MRVLKVFFGGSAEAGTRKKRDLVIDPAVGSGVVGSGIAELKPEEGPSTPWGLIAIISVIAVFAIIMVIQISGRRKSADDDKREEDK